MADNMAQAEYNVEVRDMSVRPHWRQHPLTNIVYDDSEKATRAGALLQVRHVLWCAEFSSLPVVTPYYELGGTVCTIYEYDTVNSPHY